MAVTFPGETDEYRQARDRLLTEEVELRRHMERVAEARRALPPGGPIPDDYVFTGAFPGEEPVKVRFSELFGPDVTSVAVYSWMFPRHIGDDRPVPPTGPMAELPFDETPCPSCTSFLDQLDGVARHARHQMGVVVESGVPIERMLAIAAYRGWRDWHLVSSAGTSYRRDYHGASEDGSPIPILNVFHRDPDGTVRHSWASELMFAPSEAGQDPRHNGTLDVLWNLFDLTADGRPMDWNEQVFYG